MRRIKFWKVAIACAIVSFVFFNPYTRAVAMWILPLGRGMDDFIVMAALIAGVVFIVFHFASKK